MLENLEFALYGLYMLFAFLGIQIWFLWSDVDKNELKRTSLLTDSFFRKNAIYILLFSIFSIMDGIMELINLSNPERFIELSHILAILFLVLFTYEWYSKLKSSTPRKSIPIELTGISFR